jgi:hypothetical protein
MKRRIAGELRKISSWRKSWPDRQKRNGSV